jgi:Tfp pilus assembly protein PilZ
MDTLMASDRRIPKRIRVKWPVVIISAKGYSIAETRDISSEGAFIHCQLPLNLKEKLKLFIMTPNKRPIELPAEVAWSNPDHSERNTTPRGMGVRFIKVSRRHRQLLRDIVVDHYQTKVSTSPTTE